MLQCVVANRADVRAADSGALAPHSIPVPSPAAAANGVRRAATHGGATAPLNGNSQAQCPGYSDPWRISCNNCYMKKPNPGGARRGGDRPSLFGHQRRFTRGEIACHWKGERLYQPSEFGFRDSPHRLAAPALDSSARPGKGQPKKPRSVSNRAGWFSRFVLPAEQGAGPRPRSGLGNSRC